MPIKKFYFLALIATISSQVYAGCKNFGGKCPEHSPCCSEGWCGSDRLCLATKCDPVNSFSPSSCLPKPLCVSYEDSFDSNKIIPVASFDGNPYSGYTWTSDFTPNNAAVENGQLVLSMPLGTEENEFGRLQGFGATISSVRWIQYGKVSARIKSASLSPGVVTAFIIRNPEGDEIDFEWVGGHPSQVQTNYYYNGVIDYNNGGKHEVGANTAEGFHDYILDWDEEYIKFYVDGKVVRTLYKKDTWDDKQKLYKFPSRLAVVQAGIWDGGRGSEGTIEWAGGETNWSDPKTVYKAYFDYIKIECKYGGNETQVWPTSTSSTVVASTSTSASSSSFTSSSTSTSTDSSVISSTTPIISDISRTTEQPESTSGSSDPRPTDVYVTDASIASRKLTSVLVGIASFVAGYFLS